MASDYRITTNGIEFRIEHFAVEWDHYGWWTPVEPDKTYRVLSDAKKQMEILKRGWTPVEADPNE